MKELPAIHRTVRLPVADDQRLMTLCSLTGLTISEQLRELVRGAKVVSLVEIEPPTHVDEMILPYQDGNGKSNGSGQDLPVSAAIAR